VSIVPSNFGENYHNSQDTPKTGEFPDSANIAILKKPPKVIGVPTLREMPAIILIEPNRESKVLIERGNTIKKKARKKHGKKKKGIEVEPDD
jgi:hypothetical protein